MLVPFCLQWSKHSTLPVKLFLTTDCRLNKLHPFTFLTVSWNAATSFCSTQFFCFVEYYKQEQFSLCFKTALLVFISWLELFVEVQYSLEGSQAFPCLSLDRGKWRVLPLVLGNSSLESGFLLSLVSPLGAVWFLEFGI